MKLLLVFIYSLNAFAGGIVPFMFFPISVTTVSSSSCDPAATMLIHMNGTVGSNTFTDCTGNVTLVNSATPNIQSSGMFNQAGYFNTGSVTANSQSAIALGSSDFTIEFWVKPTSGSVPGLVINGLAQVSNYAAMAFNELGGVYFSTNGTSWTGSVILTLTDSVWSHVAISRTGAKITVFKNGVSAGSYNIGAGVSLYNGTANTFGAYNGGSTGYMDELRIVKGYGKYTGTFTPPTVEF